MSWSMQTPDFRTFWGVVPVPGGDVDPSVSEPYSLGFNYSGNRAVVDVEGRGSYRTLRAMTGGFNGAERIHWIGLEGPAECCTIRVSESARRAAAEEMSAPSLVDLADVHDAPDSVLAAMGLRLRAAGRGGWEMSSLELDELGRAVLRHLALRVFGGHPPRANAHGLDPIRLARVSDYVEANLSKPILLADLGAVAGLSPFQFQRAFKRTTGLTPHAFQTAWRMDRAARMIADGRTRAEAASAVGYAPGHTFRRMLTRFSGTADHQRSQTRRRIDA